MVRRFDQYYRVKPRDNLGDPDYWNRRFEDLDRRVSSSEDSVESINSLGGYIEGLALNRLDTVLAPALDKIALVSGQGFLLAHSNSQVTLNTATSQVFTLQIAAERDLFAPSPWVTISREANNTDYAFARVLDWDKTTGALTLQPIQIWGYPGPFNDWIISVGSAVTEAVEKLAQDAVAAKNNSLEYRDQSAASAATAAQAKTDIFGIRTDCTNLLNLTIQHEQNAALWDPSSYIATISPGTYQEVITFAKSPIVPTAVATDNSQKAASTAFVQYAVASIVNSAPAALDTLKELADAIGDDANFSATVTASLGNRVRVDVNNQGLNTTQKANARTNINAAAGDDARIVNALQNNANQTITGQLNATGGFVATNGRIVSYGLSGNVNQGVVYLNQANDRYLFWDGSSYNLNGAHVYSAAGRLLGTNDAASIVTSLRWVYGGQVGVAVADGNNHGAPLGANVMMTGMFIIADEWQVVGRYLQMQIAGTWYTVGAIS